MTTLDLYSIVPSKAKAWVGLLGSLLTLAVPYVLDVKDLLPAPWPGVIGGAIAVLTTLGIYHAPYAPSGTVLAPDTPAVAAAAEEPAPIRPPLDVDYRNPWRD